MKAHANSGKSDVLGLLFFCLVIYIILQVAKCAYTTGKSIVGVGVRDIKQVDLIFDDPLIDRLVILDEKYNRIVGEGDGPLTRSPMTRNGDKLSIEYHFSLESLGPFQSFAGDSRGINYLADALAKNIQTDVLRKVDSSESRNSLTLAYDSCIPIEFYFFNDSRDLFYEFEVSGACNGTIDIPTGSSVGDSQAPLIAEEAGVSTDSNGFSDAYKSGKISATAGLLVNSHGLPFSVSSTSYIEYISTSSDALVLDYKLVLPRDLKLFDFKGFASSVYDAHWSENKFYRQIRRSQIPVRHRLRDISGTLIYEFYVFNYVDGDASFIQHTPFDPSLISVVE